MKVSISKEMVRLVVYFICLVTAIGLLVGSFFVPPKGVIDSSCLQAASILLGFYVAYDFSNTIKILKTFKLQKGDASIEGETIKND